MKIRIIANGLYYRLQKKVLFFWVNINFNGHYDVFPINMNPKNRDCTESITRIKKYKTYLEVHGSTKASEWKIL